jgi:Na+/proline symporter
MLGASVRLFVVCVVLQLLVFEPLHLPFILNVFFTVGIVWIYTFRGGVKSVVWTDSLKTFCLIVSVGLTIYYIGRNLGLNAGSMWSFISNSYMSKTFFFDNINDKRYFWKQFLAGVFTTIAITGLDQDMMQRTLSCKNFRDARKNMITGGILQIFINLLFLTLGVLLYVFIANKNIDLPAEGITKADDVFPFLAMQFSPVVGILFIVGLVSAAYAAAGSALTALTTSFTVDILESSKTKTESQTASIRKRVHFCMAIVMAAAIVVINVLNNESVIQTVYKVASYTYGPLLGMFAFGIFTQWKIRERWTPIIAIVSPLLCLVLDINSKVWFNGYEFSHERLIFNALFTFTGLCLLIRKK